MGGGGGGGGGPGGGESPFFFAHPGGTCFFFGGGGEKQKGRGYWGGCYDLWGVLGGGGPGELLWDGVGKINPSVTKGGGGRGVKRNYPPEGGAWGDFVFLPPGGLGGGGPPPKEMWGGWGGVTPVVAFAYYGVGGGGGPGPQGVHPGGGGGGGGWLKFCTCFPTSFPPPPRPNLPSPPRFHFCFWGGKTVGWGRATQVAPWGIILGRGPGGTPPGGY